MGQRSDVQDSLWVSETGPLVSVIIPCYNGEAYLQEAIESALGQSYRQVEVVVVDDGSTDRSGEIAQALPVRYVYQPNAGLCASRNLGLRESKGSYIVFLDADDRLKPHAIETGVRHLKARVDCAMVVGDHIFVCQDRLHVAPSRKKCLPGNHYEALLKSNFIEMISSVVFRRTVLEEMGGFDTELRVSEDYELYLRIARAYPILCHSMVVAEYRIHAHNTSRNSQLMLKSTLQVLRREAPYVRSDSRRLFAFLHGLRNWRTQYGRQLVHELARPLSLTQVADLRGKLAALLNNYPQGLAMFLFLRAVPRLNKSEASICGRDIPQPAPILARSGGWLRATSHSTTSVG